MSNLHDVYEPGDRILCTDHAGRVFVYMVRQDGALVLVQDPGPI